MSIPLTHHIDKNMYDVVVDATKKLDTFNKNFADIKISLDQSNKVLENGINNLTKTFTEISEKPEIKKLIDALPDLKNTGLNMLDNGTNIVALKIVGCLTTAAGLATLYRWLSSLENDQKPTWMKWLQVASKTPAKQTATAEGQDDTTQEIADNDENNDKNSEVMTDGEEKTEEECEDEPSKQTQVSKFIGKIIQPVVGTIFVLTGITCILKARAISAFVVGSSSQV